VYSFNGEAPSSGIGQVIVIEEFVLEESEIVVSKGGLATVQRPILDNSPRVILLQPLVVMLEVQALHPP
jgi:hypothetical protein